jgi:hypothetical protein
MEIESVESAARAAPERQVPIMSGQTGRHGFANDAQRKAPASAQPDARSTPPPSC